MYNYENFFSPVNNTMNILSKEELKYIGAVDMDDGGYCMRELIAWCLHEVSDVRKEGILHDKAAEELSRSILKVSGAFGVMFDYDDQPVPFFTAHFAGLLTFVFLPLNAVIQGVAAGVGDGVYWPKDLIIAIVVLLQTIVLLGLRQLGNILADPYGSDLHDLSVLSYINFTWEMSNRILNARRLPTHSDLVMRVLLEDVTEVADA